MPRITPEPWRVLECVFLAAGYAFSRQASSHRVYEREGSVRPVVIPCYDAISADIITRLLRTAGMGREEYFRLLSGCR